jgi:hypothetical protein
VDKLPRVGAFCGGADHATTRKSMMTPYGDQRRRRINPHAQTRTKTIRSER